MSYQSTVLADGAVGYWRLGEAAFGDAAVDQTTNLNGVYVNTTGLTFQQTGIAGAGGDKAVSFIAANTGYVALDSPPAALEVGDVFTLEAWVKRASNGDYHTIIAGGNSSFCLRLTNTNTLELIKDLVGGVVASTTTVTADGNFHHCAVTKNGATSLLYIDGNDVTGSVTDKTMSDPTADKFGIGYDRAAAGAPFDGVLDEVAIYPTALSGATIAAHYTLGATDSGSSYTILNGSDEQLLNINAGGTDIDAASYKYGVALTNAELATLLDGSSFGKKNIAVLPDLSGVADARQIKKTTFSAETESA